MAIRIPSPTHSLLTALRTSHSSSGFPSSTQYRNYCALAASHCSCNSSRGILRGQRPNFIASHLGVATMALSLFNFGRPNSLSNPFWLESAWSPFDLGDISRAGSFAEGARTVAGTKVDWLETDEAHVFKADLPGLKKEEVKVQLEDDRVLQISGERNQEEEKKGDKWHTVERSHGKFLRRFRLPDNAQADSVSAKVENGVLTVTVPKTQTKAPEKRNIEVA